MGLRQTGRACLRWTRAAFTSLTRRHKRRGHHLSGSSSAGDIMPEELSKFNKQHQDIYLTTNANGCCCCHEKGSEERRVIKVCRLNHTFCQECLTTLFRRAIKQPATEMPPRCCGIMVQLPLGFQFLTSEEMDVFKVLFEEWATPGKDRIYCPAQSCQQFIPVRAHRKQTPDTIMISIDEPMITTKQQSRHDSHQTPAVGPEIGASLVTSVDCPSCDIKVCAKCKNFDHPASSACQPRVDTELMAQLRAWDYRPCPRCGHYIRRMFGCMHMVCVCGEHFCWGCQKRVQDCEGGSMCDDETPDYEEEMSIDILDELTDQSLFDIGNINLFSETSNPGVNRHYEDEDDNSYEAYLRLRQAIEVDDNIGLIQASTENIRLSRQEPLVNLDGGDPRHWEFNLDLGEEPGRDTHGSVVWDGNHPWTKPELLPNLTGTHSVEVMCNVCWEVVAEPTEKSQLLDGSMDGYRGLRCWECRLVVCRDCQPAIGGWMDL